MTAIGPNSIFATHLTNVVKIAWKIFTLAKPQWGKSKYTQFFHTDMLCYFLNPWFSLNIISKVAPYIFEKFLDLPKKTSTIKCGVSIKLQGKVDESKGCKGDKGESCPPVFQKLFKNAPCCSKNRLKWPFFWISFVKMSLF